MAGASAAFALGVLHAAPCQSYPQGVQALASLPLCCGIDLLDLYDMEKATTMTPATRAAAKREVGVALLSTDASAHAAGIAKLREAAEEGDANAAALLGACYLEGAVRDAAKRTLCEATNAATCSRHWTCVTRAGVGGLHIDWSKAHELFRKAKLRADYSDAVALVHELVGSG